MTFRTPQRFKSTGPAATPEAKKVDEAAKKEDETVPETSIRGKE